MELEDKDVKKKIKLGKLTLRFGEKLEVWKHFYQVWIKSSLYTYLHILLVQRGFCMNFLKTAYVKVGLHINTYRI